MGDSVKKILFVSAEMFPYLPETRMAKVCRELPQGIQERHKEIRAFMPRYGCINERKNQLHEVIRLSGMNIIIADVDRPLVIKVASIASARIQVYFIDNEDYFRRKALYHDDEGNFFPDNGERAIFFARGVLETVKKLRWSPDIVHCSGWISHVLPLYLKKAYKDDPIFANSKVVLSLWDDVSAAPLSPGFPHTVLFGGAFHKLGRTTRARHNACSDMRKIGGLIVFVVKHRDKHCRHTVKAGDFFLVYAGKGTLCRKIRYRAEGCAVGY